MLFASQGICILVEAWKITTIVNVQVKWEGGVWLPTPSVMNKYELSDTEKKTQEYDSIVFKYLYDLTIPLFSAYSVYSMLYKGHKLWYSFIFTALVGFVHTYGFLTFINYRLKSVAHIPRKSMTYKVVNTLIDDLFAVVGDMPFGYFER